MPNVVNHAEVWSPELLEIMNQNALCSPFITTNVRWLDAKTFHFTSMSTSGFKSHNRDGGWNRGSFKQTDHPYTVEHDRDIEFLVDKADVDESDETASIQNIARVFTETQSAPEKDALFFSKTATVAKSLTGYNSSTAASSWTKENVFGRLKAMLNSGKLRRYKNKGLIMYVQGFIMDLLEQSTEFTRNISVTQVNDGGTGLETRITDIDGVPIMEVIDNETFYSAFNFDGADGGFTPAKGAFKINVLLATPMTTKVVPKISSIYHFAPGAHTEGDGYLYQERELSDVFTFPNGKDGKIDSVYADLDTEAVA
ncbi:MAG: phage capsid protein [Oscillospiraceae bacterium]|nr:phage capsid protein [Oscillospiraceae bacterium]